MKWIGYIWGKDKILGFFVWMKNIMKIDILLGKLGLRIFLFCEGSLNFDDYVFICELCYWVLVY